MVPPDRDGPVSRPFDHDGPFQASDRLDAGLQALFAVETMEEVMEAVDVAALRAGAPLAEAVDMRQLQTTVGRPAGRLLGRQLVYRVAGGGLAGVVGREIAGRAGAALVASTLDRVDPAGVDDAPFARSDSLDDRSEGVVIEVQDGSDQS